MYVRKWALAIFFRTSMYMISFARNYIICVKKMICRLGKWSPSITKPPSNYIYPRLHKHLPVESWICFTCAWFLSTFVLGVFLIVRSTKTLSDDTCLVHILQEWSDSGAIHLSTKFVKICPWVNIKSYKMRAVVTTNFSALEENCFASSELIISCAISIISWSSNVWQMSIYLTLGKARKYCSSYLIRYIPEDDESRCLLGRSIFLCMWFANSI